MVNQADTTVSVVSDDNPSAYGQDLTFTATVGAVAPGAGIPTGTVTFTVDGQSQPVNLDAQGEATFSPALLQPGSYEVDVAYSGCANFLSSSGDLDQTVNEAATTTQVISVINPSVAGQPVAFLATVQAQTPRGGVPQGTVTFTLGSQNQTVTLDGNGQATFRSGNLAAGSYTITATYSGDSQLAGSSGSVVQTVDTPSTSSGTLAVFDPTTDQVLPRDGTPYNSFSAWTMSLQAQVSGTAVASYSWDTSQAPDVTSVTGQNSYNLQFTWANFSGSINTDVISLTETSQDGSQITASYVFQVTGTDNPGWVPCRPPAPAPGPTSLPLIC